MGANPIFFAQLPAHDNSIKVSHFVVHVRKKSSFHAPPTIKLQGSYYFIQVTCTQYS